MVENVATLADCAFDFNNRATMRTIDVAGYETTARQRTQSQDGEPGRVSAGSCSTINDIADSPSAPGADATGLAGPDCSTEEKSLQDAIIRCIGEKAGR